ncbi:MAG: hypothetical protein AAGI53_02955 [Planctomycetota bacterium]
MLHLERQFGTFAVLITVVIMFFGLVVFEPVITASDTPGKFSGVVAAAIASLGTYRLAASSLLWLFGRSQALRRALLGDAYIEGVWVGYYRHGDSERFTIETIDQKTGETTISGLEFDSDGTSRAHWSSESVFIDKRRRKLTYVYSCDVYGTSHQQNGIGSFQLYSSGKYPDRIDGYSVDMIDGQKDPNTEHKVSETPIPIEDALNRARAIFTNDA